MIRKFVNAPMATVYNTEYRVSAYDNKAWSTDIENVMYINIFVFL